MIGTMRTGKKRKKRKKRKKSSVEVVRLETAVFFRFFRGCFGARQEKFAIFVGWVPQSVPGYRTN